MRVDPDQTAQMTGGIGPRPGQQPTGCAWPGSAFRMASTLASSPAARAP